MQTRRTRKDARRPPSTLSGVEPASAINGIESVKHNAPNAEIDDQTDK